MEVDDVGQVTEPDAATKVLKSIHLLDIILKFSLEQKRDELFVFKNRTRQGNLRGFLELRLVDKIFNERVFVAMRREFKKVRIDVDDYYISCNRFQIQKHLVEPRPPVHRPPVAPGIDRQAARAIPPNLLEIIEQQAGIIDDVMEEMLAVNGMLLDQLNPQPPQFPHPHPPNRIQRPAREVAIPAEGGAEDDEMSEDGEEDDEMNDGDDDDGGDDMEMPEDRSEDLLDSRFLEKFMKWLAETFNPNVESLKIYDSWSLKPCSAPSTWTALHSFRSFHPDMDYCACARCIQVVKTCHTFHPISFKMLQDSLTNETKTFRTLGCTDAFLADIAIHYTLNRGDTLVFDAERFASEFGKIKVDELLLATQCFSDTDMTVYPQPLEVIQLIIKLWEVETIHFELLKAMENEYYVKRRSWESSGAFHHAYLLASNYDSFEANKHVMPYRTAGTLDAHSPRDIVVPIFDMRGDSTEPAHRMSSSLSLLSLASRDNVDDTGYPQDYPFQGRIAFNMFRSSHICFVQSGQSEFQGPVGVANWLKYLFRGMMRWTWGARNQTVAESNKHIYWIYFVDDGPSIGGIWREHLGDLLRANFPKQEVIFDDGKQFKKCPNPRVPTYHCISRPDVQEAPIHTYYVTLYEGKRKNTTNFKFVQVNS